MNHTHTQPADIERRSMEILSGELARRGIVLPPENEAVIRRVIHTTADFDYAQTLTFTPQAVAKGVLALSRGTPIITDTNMAKAGISKPGLQKLGSRVECFMADPEVADAARRHKTTRAVAAMEKTAGRFPDAVFAVGNAPTALFALAEQLQAGVRPALIIGVPVGFVNVVEAKEHLFTLCRQLEVPAIVAFGRKGGSNVAAAICNALLYQAADLQDPANRGW